MDKYQKQIMAFLRGLTASQRILLACSVVLVAGTVWIFVRLIGGADYSPLYTGLAAADAQSLTQKLSAQNIQFQLSTDGTTVLVPSDQLDKARLQIASQGPIASGRMGFELFDKPNWSGSDFSEKVNYQRALEAELERTIQSMDGVEAVRVHLVLPHDSLFTDRERPAKAAVVLKIRGGRMSDQVAGSISNLVSSAWDDLTPQNVSVITTDGQVPSSGHGQGGDGANGMADLETALAERVVQVLTPIVGPDHVKSSVTIEYDPTSDDSTQDVYDPTTSAVLTSQMSQENAENVDPSGIPGTASNAPNTPPAGNAATQNETEQTAQGIRSESKTFAVSHTTHHLIQPAGRIKRIAAAILVDDVVEAKDDSGKTAETRRKRTPEEMKSIEDLSKAALGWDATRGDQISVQDVAFQAQQIEKPEAISLPNRVRVIAEQWTGLLRYAALLVLFMLVYFLLLNPVKRRVIAALESVQVRVAPGRAIGGEAEAAALPNKFGNEQALIEETSRTSPQFTQALALKQQIVTKVKTDPEGASRLVQDWMRGSGVRS